MLICDTLYLLTLTPVGKIELEAAVNHPFMSAIISVIPALEVPSVTVTALLWKLTFII